MDTQWDLWKRDCLRHKEVSSTEEVELHDVVRCTMCYRLIAEGFYEVTIGDRCFSYLLMTVFLFDSIMLVTTSVKEIRRNANSLVTIS